MYPTRDADKETDDKRRVIKHDQCGQAIYHVQPRIRFRLQSTQYSISYTTVLKANGSFNKAAPTSPNNIHTGLYEEGSEIDDGRILISFLFPIEIYPAVNRAYKDEGMLLQQEQRDH